MPEDLPFKPQYAKSNMGVNGSSTLEQQPLRAKASVLEVKERGAKCWRMLAHERHDTLTTLPMDMEPLTVDILSL